jgi:hypothetical protein
MGAAALSAASAIGATMVSTTFMWATAAGAITEIGIKAGMRGMSYVNSRDMAIDIVMGVVDTASAGIGSLKIGGKLLGEGIGTAAKVEQGLAQAAKSTATSRLERMAVHGIASGIEGLAMSAPSAIGGAVMNPENWKGDVFANISKSAGMSMGIAAGAAGLLGGVLGGWSKPKAFGEISAAEREVLTKAWLEKNPGGDVAKLAEEFNAGKVAGATHEALAAFNKEMRRTPRRSSSSSTRSIWRAGTRSRSTIRWRSTRTS